MNIKLILSLSAGLVLTSSTISANPKPITTVSLQNNKEQTTDTAIAIKKQALYAMEAINETFKDLHSANKNSAIDNAIEHTNSLIALLKNTDSAEELNRAQKSSFQSVLKRVQQVKISLEEAKSESTIRKVKQGIVEAKKNLGKALGTIDKAINQGR